MFPRKSRSGDSWNAWKIRGSTGSSRPQTFANGKRWDDYQDAYEKMIRNTASEYAPWVVVPADNKWFTRLVVVATIVDALTSLDLKYPKLNDTKLKEFAAARKQLEKE
jgi:polyphosphate kinase 2 (PPK2 family)